MLARVGIRTPFGRDAVAAATLAAAGVVVTLTVHGEVLAALAWVLVPLVVLESGVIAWRRRSPLLVLAAAVAAYCAALAAFGLHAWGYGVMVSSYTATAYRRGRLAGAAIGLAAVTVVVAGLVAAAAPGLPVVASAAGTTAVTGLTTALVSILLPGCVGAYVATRRAHRGEASSVDDGPEPPDGYVEWTQRVPAKPMRSEDVTGVVTTRRRIARSTLAVRIVAWPMLLLSAVNVAIGRVQALALVAVAVTLLWAARSARAGRRAGGFALVACGVLWSAFVLVAVTAEALQSPEEALAALATGTAFAALGGAVAAGGLISVRVRDPECFHGLGGRPRMRPLRLGDVRRPAVATSLLASALVALIAFSLLPVNGLLAGVVLLPAVWLFRRAQARAAPGADRAVEQDPRPPVLYLRSFGDEDVTVRGRLSRRRALLENLQWPATDRFEEVVVRHLADYGPVVAAGRPGERVPKLGAAREYLPDREWQRSIARRIDDAGLIAVVLGRTRGLEWEVTALVEAGALARTIVVVPSGDPDEVARRWRAQAIVLARAGGPVLDPELDGGQAVNALVVLPADGRIVCGRRRDEWHYETALHRAASTTAGARHEPRGP